MGVVCCHFRQRMSKVRSRCGGGGGRRRRRRCQGGACRRQRHARPDANASRRRGGGGERRPRRGHIGGGPVGSGDPNLGGGEYGGCQWCRCRHSRGFLVGAPTNRPPRAPETAEAASWTVVDLTVPAKQPRSASAPGRLGWTWPEAQALPTTFRKCAHLEQGLMNQVFLVGLEYIQHSPTCTLD